ncbi:MULTISPECIES: hypothetical protein [unclassified Epibacterium]|jgi:hypothetical protein|uniref:hypothetical protein n=1 Tax=unclassified Epibacterium TaxID=2639179 RepID=UPI001EF4D8F7|nr:MULTISPECIES: hypothetical protein [unclassified Epibacterium]MCG7623645.1 hypothetical protein [Epibacterium sp. Ofav1-8]MCG7628176.1 hypothetical protein [Epibacterium sp. MM17-32]
MKQDKMLGQMRAVTNAVYLREHAKVKPLLDREAQLRGKLSMLKQQVEDSKALIDKSHEMKTLGVDLQWQQWHTNARRDLNQELAQVTAQKFRAMDKLRQAFGRKHAVETMESKHKADAKAHRNKMLFDRLMNLD